MSDFLSSQTLAADRAFVTRVRHAAVTTAIEVMAEDPETAEHAARVVLAARVLDEPDIYAARFALGVVANAAISGASTDSDLHFTIASLWAAYARGRTTSGPV